MLRSCSRFDTSLFQPVKLRCCMLFAVIMMMVAHASQAQLVIKVEYFVDTDPGHGLATSVPVTPAPDLTDVAFTINPALLAPGFHNLYVRSQDEGLRWSLAAVRTLYKDPLNPGSLPDITQVEYFVDNDPGNGLAVQVPVVPGTNLSELLFPLDISLLSPGFHQLFIRAKDSGQKWSLAAVRAFYNDAASGTPLPEVARVEYFIDTDPGHGMATTVPVTPGTNLSDIVFSLDIGAMAPGFHQLYIRSEDAMGNWSLAAVRSFYKDSGTGTPLPDITRVEYFIDTDPGHGLATQVPVAPGTDLTNLAFPLDIVSLATGFHQLYIRSEDALGKWGVVAVRTFYKSETGITVPDVTGAEYFIDNDPGCGAGTGISLSPGASLNLLFPTDIIGLPRGPHQVFFRAMDGQGKWSLTNVNAITYSGFSIEAGGVLDICPGQSVPLVAPVSPGKTYQWHRNDLPLAGGNSPVYNASDEGAYYVLISAAGYLNDTSNTLLVTHKPTVAAPVVVGPDTVCTLQSGVTYLTRGGMMGYLWSVSPGGNILAGGGTADSSVTVMWNVPGNQTVSVNYSGPNGCYTLQPASFSVMVNAVPVPSVTGDTLCCSGDTILYQTELGMTDYTWVTGPGGTVVSGGGSADSSLLVVWTTAGVKTVGVNYTHVCRSATPATASTQVDSLPFPAGTIAGPSVVNIGMDDLVFYVEPVAGATSYTWLLPDGAEIISGWNTDSISVSFSGDFSSGNISVCGVNPCGNGTFSPVFAVSALPPVLPSVNLQNLAIGSNMVQCYNASEEILVAGNLTWFIVQNGAAVTMISGGRIVYRAGTKVDPGGYLHGYINRWGQYCGDQKVSQTIESAETGVKPEWNGGKGNPGGFTCYPNPTSGGFLLRLDEEPGGFPVQVNLYNSLGVVMASRTIRSGVLHYFSLENQPGGLYLLRIERNGTENTIRVIRQ